MAHRTAVVLGVLVGALTTALVGGIAWAAIPGPGGVIQGCYDNGGNLKVVNSLPCPKNWTPLQWSQTGPPGVDGTNGTNGTDGTNGADGEDGADGLSPTVEQLDEGDANCPAGGAAITDANNVTAYVCSGQAGADGEGFTGTYTAGNYSISVTTSGITLSGPSSRKIEMTDGATTIDAGLLPLSIDSGSFDLDALTIDAAATTTASIKGGVSFRGEGAATAEIKGGAATVIDGGIIDLGAGCTNPVAKVTSLVLINAGTLTGQVTTGDPTVRVC